MVRSRRPTSSSMPSASKQIAHRSASTKMRSKIPWSTSSAWSSRSTRTCAAAPENPASRTPQPTPRSPSAAPVFWSILPIPRKHRAKCWLEFIHVKPAERALAATNVRSRPVPSHGPGSLPRRHGHALVDLRQGSVISAVALRRRGNAICAQQKAPDETGA
jgi:hypothetical protein